MTDEADERATILNAIITNTRTKILFGGLAPDDADFMTRVMFTGFADLEEWKQGSARPTAIGNKKEIVRSHSRAEHEAEHHTEAHTTSHSHGEAVGTSTSTGISSGDFTGSGDSAGMVMQAPAQLFGPNQPNAQMMPVPLTQNSGESKSRGSSDMSSESKGESHVSMDSYGEADTVGHGTSRGTSVTEGESETFVTDYAWMPTQFYSLPEQLHRLAGEVMNLALRECFVKIGNQKPVRTRTVDLPPTFKSDYFRRLMLPIFHKKMLAQSPYLFPVAEVDAQIAARMPETVKASPSADFSPAPLPIVDAPVDFAADFWNRRAALLPDPPKPKRSPGRKPATRSTKGQPDLRIVDGGKDEGVDKPKDE